MLLILHSFIPCVASAPWQREVADVGGTLGFVTEALPPAWGFCFSIFVTNPSLGFVPQPQLRVLIPGHLSCVLCHGGTWNVDPSVPSQSTGCAEDSRDLQLPALWHQR